MTERAQRIKKVAATIEKRYPPARKPGKVVLVKVYSDRVLTNEELDKRAGPPKPGEHRILLNVVKVRPFKRRPEDAHAAATSPAPGSPAAEERELERRVRELEAKKARLLEERGPERQARKPEDRKPRTPGGRSSERDGESELKRRRRRLHEIQRAARAADRRAWEKAGI